MLAGRRAEYDRFIWQTPALALTAQAFLLTIALNPTAFSALARVLTAVLGFVIMVISIQLLRRNRYMEHIDSLFLHELELARENSEGSRYYRQYHEVPAAREAHLVERGSSSADRVPVHTWWNQSSSMKVWTWGLALVALADVAIVVLILFSPGVFS